MEKRVENNIKKIMTAGHMLLLAYDQGLEHGPTDFSGKNIDPGYILDIAKKCRFNGIIFQKGVAEQYYSKKDKIPLIIKLNGKTNLYKGEPISRQICSVKEAINIGAKAVGYTIYPGSIHEPIMMREFGKIEEEAHKNSLPVIVWMYPRGKAVKELTPDLIAYAARIGLEIGADFVKIKYTGSPESFSKVVKDAGKCRVLALGGEKKSDKELLEEASGIVKSGAAGMAIGRNIWQNKDPFSISEKLRKVVIGK